MHPVQRDVTDYLELTGNTQAIQTVQLVARVTGYLDKVFFHDGQFVKKGQLLFLLQQDTFISKLQQAEGQVSALQAQLEYAQAQYVRYSNLLPQNAASKTDVDNWRFQRDSAMANLKTAIANRDLARQDLSYTRISAPFSGRIDRRLQDPGNLVGVGNNTVLASINQIDPIYVYFSISDSDWARLSKFSKEITGGSSAKVPLLVGLSDEEGYPHKGQIDFAAISLTSTTGSLLMRGIMPNPNGKILPGIYTRVHVPLETRPAWLIPDTAIGNDQQGSYVLIVNNQNIVERRSVKTGPRIDNMFAIKEGLDGGEWVIINGLLRAIPGRPVTPQQAPAQPETPSTKPIKGK